MDLNNTNNRVVVVEGYHDLSHLHSIYPNLDIVVTNGSEISSETLHELKQLNESRGLILFLDPDVPGERIRRIINDHVGETAHAFLPKDKCISKNKKKVGIEHAKKEDIIQALKDFKLSSHNHSYTWTTQDLLDLRLVGCKDAKSRRKRLSDELGIGLANGKTLRKKLTMFNMTKEDITQLLNR